MEYKLEYLIDDEPKTVYLNKDIIMVGKLIQNDIELNDATVSRQHCKLERVKDDSYRLVDLGSTNGSYVNGQRVQQQILQVGDHITIGRTVMNFLAVPKEESYQDLGDQKISMVVPLIDLIRAEKKENLSTENFNLFAQLTILGKNLLASPNLEDSFQKIDQLIFDFVKPESICFFSYDDKHNDLILKHSDSRKKKKGETVNISKTIALKAIHEKVAILSSNTKDDNRFDSSKSIIMYGITSAISVPIWTKDSIYGLIYIDSTSVHRLFGKMDLEIMSMIANFSGLSIEGLNSLEKLNRERKLRARLERYHSPGVVSRLMEMQDDPQGEIMSYREAEASVLFLDIVNFTPMAEKKTPVEVGILLNNFFTEMTEIIFKHNGTLDKFIGDAIMAVFGVPLEIKNHPEKAIQAAIDMLKRMEELNSQVDPANRIQVRVGINCGKLISGDFGSPKRLDYTVLGNTVNIASRLESVIAGPDEIIVSDAIYQITKHLFEFESLGEKRVQGISQPLKAYKVIPRRKKG